MPLLKHPGHRPVVKKASDGHSVSANPTAGEVNGRSMGNAEFGSRTASAVDSVTSFSVSHSKLLFMHDFERDGVNIFKSLGTMTNNENNQKGRVSTPASLRLPGSTH